MKIIIKNLQKKVPVNPKRVKLAILNALSLKGAHKSGEITVCFVNDLEIRKLNLRYLGKDSPTDVLTFDITGRQDKKNNIFSDIVVSTDRAVDNARVYKTDPLHETYLYVVHGILHLLGYDDKTAKQRERMNGIALRIIRDI